MEITCCEKCHLPNLPLASEWHRSQNLVCTCQNRATLASVSVGTAIRPVGEPVKTDRHKLENLLADQLTEAGIEFEREFRFCPPRRWRCDFLLSGTKIVVEVEGMVPGGKGRHQTFTGAENDCIKYNRLAVMGFLLIRVTGRMVRRNEAVPVILELLSATSAEKENEDDR